MRHVRYRILRTPPKHRIPLITSKAVTKEHLAVKVGRTVRVSRLEAELAQAPTLVESLMQRLTDEKHRVEERLLELKTKNEKSHKRNQLIRSLTKTLKKLDDAKKDASLLEENLRKDLDDAREAVSLWGGADEWEKDLLLNTIINMLKKLANRFGYASQFDFEDLLHDCVARVWNGLDTYDPKRGVLTTWSWYVAKRVIQRDKEIADSFRGLIRICSPLLPEEPEKRDERSLDDYAKHEEDIPLRLDVRRAIDELYRRCGVNVRRKKFLDVLFVPVGQTFVMRSGKEAAEMLGCQASVIKIFIKRFVQPVFVRLMKGEVV